MFSERKCTYHFGHIECYYSKCCRLSCKWPCKCTVNAADCLVNGLVNCTVNAADCLVNGLVNGCSAFNCCTNILCTMLEGFVCAFYFFLYVYIIESVDSISRDERDVSLTQYITNARISRTRYTITHFKHHHRVLRLISNRMSV